MTFTVLKGIALLVFLGAIAGATYGVQTLVGDTLTTSLVTAEPVHGRLNATGGQEVTFAVAVRNRDDAAQPVVVVLEGEGLRGESAPTAVPGGQTQAVFVPVAVPQDAAVGPHALKARLLDASGAVLRDAVGSVELNVLAPAAGLQEGQVPGVVYTIRHAGTGEVHVTNDPALQRAGFARTSGFTPEEAPSPLVPGQALDDLYEGVIGMQVGESRRVEGFSVFYREQPREMEIELVRTYPLEEQSERREAFDQMLRENGHDPETIEVGDEFTQYVPDTKTTWRFVVTNLTDAVARFRYDMDVGERYTTFPAWTNASVVEAFNETSVTFRTEPPTAPGERFTWFSVWPDATELVRVEGDVAVLRHSPAPGTTHDERNPANPTTPLTFTVHELRDDVVVLTAPRGTPPLAGEAFVADVRLVEIVAG